MLATTEQQKQYDKAFVKVWSSIFLTFSFTSFATVQPHLLPGSSHYWSCLTE